MCKFMERFMKKAKWYDMSCLKLCVFFCTLFLITAWTGFRNLVLSVAWYWYATLAIIFAIPLLVKMYKK